MKKPLFEKNFIILALGAFLLFSVGGVITTIVPPLVDPAFYKTDKEVHTYSAQEERGIKLYLENGCVYCHTQQVRKLRADMERYGWRLVDAPASESWEYVKQRTNFLGTKRTGPDLARVGGKYSSEWHWAHFRDPRNMGEKFQSNNKKYQSASVMPSFNYLTDAEIKDLTAYIQTLGKDMNWRVDKNGKTLNDFEQ